MRTYGIDESITARPASRYVVLMHACMAYRRRHGITRSSTFKEDSTYRPSNPNDKNTTTSSSSAPTSPLKTTRSSSRDSPLSSGFINSALQSSSQNRSKVGVTRSSTFKEEIHRPPNDNTTSSSSAPTSPLASIYKGTRASDTHRESPLSSGYINSAFQSSFHDRSKEGGTDKRGEGSFKLENWSETNNEEFFKQNLWQEGRMQSATPQSVQEHQLKASRDVAIATAAKAKLLLREIKTVKSDLAFAKERSCQLEEENKILREAREKGDHPADDDMIRLQLETLLEEKARLAHENSVYIRENSCLREIIKYHKLSTQDVVYLDEGIEEVAEVNPSISRTLTCPLPESPRSIQTNNPESSNVPTLDNLRLEDSMKHDGT